MEQVINCLRCNRRLKTVKSRELGFGPVCYKKHLQEQADKEFKKNQTTIDEYLGDEHNATNDSKAISQNEQKAFQVS
ncbi:hypothetical protein HNQ35_000040 [Cerasibacillus quisquiliarum]|uniref:Uncharacterized protein n=1 Tax=Cerasibacillus quisquiliarum TaxID=227865 RepID=A0A511UUH1_9BACI|nr:DUF6011 domain-containing protein [Cerasibacillus quisquiliarum]MBB5144851.1 hypothetical protein [Cerasibacillus quisquiliarum]GEN30256.1 hypothetical protein CQU01_04940 [Cerasibacillus quisquiliarum]